VAKVVIAGVVRNCAHVLIEELSRIENALKNHDIARIVIVESDSTDDSALAVEKWSCEAERNTSFSLGLLAGSYPRRTERLAYCRNVYIKFLERHEFFNADYLLVSDLDGVNSKLTSESLDAVFAWLARMPGSAATANQLYKYYDVWALRHPIWSPNDCWECYHQLQHVVSDVNAHRICNESRMIHIDQGLPPIEVESAFGGAAIYSTSMLSGCRYSGLKNDQEICEHVSFSNMYRSNGGRIFVHPAFINHDVSEHVLNAERFELRHTSDSIVGNE
jgi:hypothetical protein